jgi:hypothetical protein
MVTKNPVYVEVLQAAPNRPSILILTATRMETDEKYGCGRKFVVEKCKIYKALNSGG